MLRRLAVLAFMTVVPGCASHDPSQDLTVRVAQADGRCRLEVEGKRVSSDELIAIVKSRKAWLGRGQVIGDPKTPYRCIGGAIYSLQLAGFPKVEFNSP
jgi:hypothetical protein